jgi:hypothetical protein
VDHVQRLSNTVTRVCIASKNRPPLGATKDDVVEESAERPWCPMAMADPISFHSKQSEIRAPGQSITKVLGQGLTPGAFVTQERSTSLLTDQRTPCRLFLYVLLAD